MIKTTNNCAETTAQSTYLDPFGDLMASMRITGSVLLNERYTPPWGVAIPSTTDLHKVLQLPRGVHPVAFHLVKRGYISVTTEGGAPVSVEAGELLICTGGQPHQISYGETKRFIPVATLLARGKNPFQPSSKSKVPSTSLMCGVFLMRNAYLNPLLTALPPMLHISTNRNRSPSDLSLVMRWMCDEAERPSPGSTFVVERLLELLCAEAFRGQLQDPAPMTGWFKGLDDPIVGRALAVIHARPGESWSVTELAQSVNISPSRFAARFAMAMGQSAMAYVTKWRMHVAGRRLTETHEPVGKIAEEMGYENVAAFARTFKRHLGVPPARWRAHQQVNQVEQRQRT